MKVPQGASAAFVSVVMALNVSVPDTLYSASAQGASQGTVLKARARIVTVDVVVTDSKGNAIRDLKPEEMEVHEKPGGVQKIAHFRFVDRTAAPSPDAAVKSTPTIPADAVTNRLASLAQRTPPTVLLLDALNTETTTQTQARRHMVRLLKTLPNETPVAVLLLGRNLRVLQGFTLNRELLRQAVDKALDSSTMKERQPLDDPTSRSWALQELSLGHDQPDTSGMRGPPPLQIVASHAEALMAFEKEVFASQLDYRISVTVEAMRTIAAFLAGYSGRKNLIWFSGSFPLSVAPDPSLGRRAFASTRSELDKVSAASSALSDAQVAVYPVDPRGLQTYESFSVSESARPGAGSGSFTAGVNREGEARYQSVSTMESLAQDTGGRVCRNNNDLAGCVQTAVKDASSYYELAYYPPTENWNGEFRRVEVKSARRGTKLSYRRGYFAVDDKPKSEQEASETLKRAACFDYLPATSIPLVVHAVPAERPTHAQYRLLITPDALATFPGAAAEFSFVLALCHFSNSGEPQNFTARDMSDKITDQNLKNFQQNGVTQMISIAPSPNTARIRFAVLERTTGLTGSVDVPVELKTAAVAPPAGTTPPAARPAAPARPLSHAVTLRGSQGQTGVLDWSGDRVTFTGDLPADQAAVEFFNGLWGAEFQCVNGKLAHKKASSTAQPQPHANLRNPAGRVAIIDLSGKQPEFKGELPVDKGAKNLFTAIWRLYHCAE